MEDLKFPSRTNYQKKYKALKNYIKEIVLENAALCDQASDLQHQIVVAQEERKFLFKKLTLIQGTNNQADADDVSSVAAGQTPDHSRTKVVKKSSNPQPRKRPQSKPKQKPPSQESAPSLDDKS